MLFHKLQPQFDQCSVQYQALRYVSVRNKKDRWNFFSVKQRWKMIVQYIFYSWPGKLTNCFMVMKKLAQERLREPSSVFGV